MVLGLSDFSLIPPPEEELKAQKQRWKDQLDLEKTITESLYQGIKQRYYQDLMPKEKAQAPAEKIRSVSSEILDKVRSAYADAYALKAFREVLGPEQQTPQAQQVATQPEDEKRSAFLQGWMKWAERDQEKAMQFLNNLSEEQLSKLAYLDTKEDAGLARLLPMLSSGKSNVSDILAVINQLPKAPSPQEYMDTAIQLSDKMAPKPQTDGGYTSLLREEVSEMKKMNAALQEQLHKREIDEKDKEIEGYRQSIERLEEKMSSASGSTNPDIALQIERLKTEREMKMEELRQAHDRWLAEQNLESKKWDQIGQIIKGPVGKFVENIGGAASDKIRGAPVNPNIPVKVEKIICTNCGKPFYANTLAEYAVCASCGMLLRRSAEAAQQKTEVTQQTEATQSAKPEPEEGSATE